MSFPYRILAPLSILLLLAACSSTPQKTVPGSGPTPKKTVKMIPAAKGGGYYKDDGPGDEVPDNLDEIPDAEPRQEPLHRWANRPYVVLGKEYVPQTSVRTFRQQGIASWYGKKFHGQKTSIGETYDMFAMTAAHPTLAIPSYARVTHVATGRSVIVRVNDRGPFHANRVMDLSYAAAHKLGYIQNGSSEVVVETIIPGSYVPDPASTPASAPVAVPPPRILPQKMEDDLDVFTEKLAREEKSPPSSGLPGRGIFLQLGAFANEENAENLRDHLARDLEWLTDPIRIHTAGNIHRLHLGPYPNRTDAERVAQQIKSSLGYAPTIVTR